MASFKDIQDFLRSFYEKNQYIALAKNYYYQSKVAAHAKSFYAKHKLIVRIAAAIFILLIVSKLFFHDRSHEKDNAKKNKQPPTVLISFVKKENIPVYLTALGSIVPDKAAVIKTQVNGQLLKVLVEDGQLVKEGNLLAEIDSRLYKAQLLQYEGQLAKDIALLKNAKLDHERYIKLVKQGAISAQTLDTQKSLVQQYEGTVKSDQGLVDSAKLNCDYCSIKAPFSGKIGIFNFDPGNYIQTSDANGLVTLNCVNPISVLFSIPQDDLQRILKRMNTGNKMKVDAFDRDQDKMLGTGILVTVDNQIDSTTGSVKLKALFQNEDSCFFPNQFVNVRLLVNTLNDSIIVPTTAIQHSPNGSFVYKLQGDNTVKVVSVEVKTVNGNDSAVVGDIKPNDSIIIEGTDKLYDGAVVKVSVQKQNVELPKKGHVQNDSAANNKVSL